MIEVSYNEVSLLNSLSFECEYFQICLVITQSEEWDHEADNNQTTLLKDSITDSTIRWYT